MTTRKAKTAPHPTDFVDGPPVTATMIDPRDLEALAAKAEKADELERQLVEAQEYRAKFEALETIHDATIAQMLDEPAAVTTVKFYRDNVRYAVTTRSGATDEMEDESIEVMLEAVRRISSGKSEDFKLPDASDEVDQHGAKVVPLWFWERPYYGERNHVDSCVTVFLLDELTVTAKDGRRFAVQINKVNETTSLADVLHTALIGLVRASKWDNSKVTPAQQQNAANDDRKQPQQPPKSNSPAKARGGEQTSDILTYEYNEQTGESTPIYRPMMANGQDGERLKDFSDLKNYADGSLVGFHVERVEYDSETPKSGQNAGKKIKVYKYHVANTSKYPKFRKVYLDNKAFVDPDSGKDTVLAQHTRNLNIDYGDALEGDWTLITRVWHKSDGVQDFWPLDLIER